MRMKNELVNCGNLNFLYIAFMCMVCLLVLAVYLLQIGKSNKFKMILNYQKNCSQNHNKALQSNYYMLITRCNGI